RMESSQEDHKGRYRPATTMACGSPLGSSTLSLGQSSWKNRRAMTSMKLMSIPASMLERLHCPKRGGAI
ncbi:hypothetical protein, partial [Sphingobium sp. D43FB]|uniref:hypothetical protein n=1 Tax=Sphingobium sp. D43FB TaxID=2017595 RepID=UPI001C3ED5EF